MQGIDIRPVGDAAVLAVLGDAIDPQTVERAWSFTAQLRDSMGAGVLDIVPAYASVLVRFDPFATDLPRVMAAIRGASERRWSGTNRPFRRFTIAVTFGGEHGVDFERAAHELGMREARLREAFCKPEYRVAFVGFLAGFPYLLGLPRSLNLRRLASPRPHVPAGSVAVASGQCGIYPRQSPGGWQLLGRTAAALFDPARDAPALLAPRDAVRFVAAARYQDTAAIDVENIG